jgi:hypothetical protein
MNFIDLMTSFLRKIRKTFSYLWQTTYYRQLQAHHNKYFSDKKEKKANTTRIDLM